MEKIYTHQKSNILKISTNILLVAFHGEMNEILRFTPPE